MDATAEDVQYGKETAGDVGGIASSYVGAGHVEVFDDRETEMENESDIGTQDIDIDESEESESDEDLAAAIDRELTQDVDDEDDEDNEDEDEEEESEDEENEEEDEAGTSNEIGTLVSCPAIPQKTHAFIFILFFLFACCRTKTAGNFGDSASYPAQGTRCPYRA